MADKANALSLAHGQVIDLVKSNRKTIESKLPKQLDVNRFLAILFTEFRRTPKLLSCSQDSLIKTIFQCAQIGLYPDSVLGLAYLIPYGPEATLVPGYKGYVELADRGGVVLDAHPIYENDQFDFSYGTEHYLRHSFDLKKERGALIGAWAKASGKTRDPIFEVMSREDVEEVRASSASYKNQKLSSPWTTHEAEMYRKSAIRRISKLVPMCPELQRAVAFEGKQDAGEDGSLVFDDDSIDVTDDSKQAAAATKKASEKLRERMANAPTAQPVADDCGCPDGPAGLHEPTCPQRQPA